MPAKLTPSRDGVERATVRVDFRLTRNDVAALLAAADERFRLSANDTPDGVSTHYDARRIVAEQLRDYGHQPFTEPPDGVESEWVQRMTAKFWGE
jgi:hypothetical protein